MEISQFVETMERIVRKVVEAGGLAEDDAFVSGDPDFIADFGVDRNGNLVIFEETFPIRIESLTDVRYRFRKDEVFADGYIRFEFGPDRYLNVYLDDCSYTNYQLVMGDRHVFVPGQGTLEELKKTIRENG